MGVLYMKKQNWENTKIVLKHACKSISSALAWEGLGLACLHLNDLKEAEKALSIANVLN